MADVRLKGIKKVYDNSVVAVQDFNLFIEDKEFIVLVGPSGCGKTTTLRMIAGLEEITEGELYIGEKLVNDVAPKDRDIAMVFQNYALYPHMTVYENMAFALKLRKVGKQEIDKKVRETAEILNITELLKRKPKALSGGQRQRVAIGRAIVREPKVFLMDEPLSNLDAKLRNQMRAEIIKLHQGINTTFIYVTHDQTEAMTLGDRIVIMKDGFIQQIGTPQEVFDNPVNLFVGGFIGTPQMNFFEARLTRTGKEYTIECDGVRILFPIEKQNVLADNNQESCEMIMGIRPEHIGIELVHEGKNDNADMLVAEIDLYEMMGSEVYIHVVFQEKKAVIRVPMADMKNLCALNELYKKKVYLKIPGEMIHIFAKESGESLFLNRRNEK